MNYLKKFEGFDKDKNPSTITTICKKCKGSGYINYLVNQHSDETERDICIYCKGSGKIHQMTDAGEQEYRDNYW